MIQKKKLFKNTQVVNSKTQLPLNMKLIKKHSRQYDEDNNIYSNEEKITNNNSNKYICKRKDIRHDNDDSRSSTLSIYPLSKQNNQELIEKELRHEYDIFLQHNVKETFENTSQKLLH